MRLITALFLSQFGLILFGQNIDSLKTISAKIDKEIKRLEKEINVKQDSLHSLEFHNEEIKKQIALEQIDPNSKNYLITTNEAFIYESYTAASRDLLRVRTGESLLILERYDDLFWKVMKDDVVGYINNSNIDQKSIPQSFIEKRNAEKLVGRQAELAMLARENEIRDSLNKEAGLKVKAAIKAQKEERKKALYSTYGQEIADKIIAHKFWIGMTSEMAIESIGKPQDINRTVGAWGIHEQWIYDEGFYYFDNLYLYFQDGKLTSWQD